MKDDYSSKISINDILIFLLLAAIAMSVPILYVSKEKYMYFWDSALYNNIASEFVLICRHSLLDALRLLKNSLYSDYNGLYCLPIAPFMIIFGDTRLVYISSIALIYVVPFSLLTGMAAVETFSKKRGGIFWIAALTALLIPVTWRKTLNGAPDIGAAAMISLAALVYLRDAALRQWWRAPLIGLILVSAVIFRRHYATSAGCFIAAMAITYFIKIIFEHRSNIKEVTRRALIYYAKIALSVIVMLAVLKLAAPALLGNIVSGDPRILYKDFSASEFVFLRYYKGSFGIIVLYLAAFGFFSGYMVRSYMKDKLGFIAIFGLLLLAQWLSLGYVNKQYGMHFILFVVVGITGLFYATRCVFKGVLRFLLSGAIILLIIFNFIIAMTPVRISDRVLKVFPVERTPPWVMPNYDNVSRLIELLRRICPNGEPIYIVAGSITLNRDQVINGERQLFGRGNTKLNVLPVPLVDSRDFYPIDSLLRAKYAVVAIPIQNIALLREQNLTKAAFALFAEDSEFVADFIPSTEHPAIDTNVTSTIFKRVRPTGLKTALHALEYIRKTVKVMPGDQSDWFVFDDKINSRIERNRNSMIDFVANNINSSTLIYFGNISMPVNVTGEIFSTINRAGWLSLRFTALDAEGEAISDPQTINLSNGAFKTQLRFDGSQKAYYLRMDILHSVDNLSQQSFDIWIKNLDISNPPVNQ